MATVEKVEHQSSVEENLPPEQVRKLHSLRAQLVKQAASK